MTKFKNAMVAAIIAVAAIGCGVTPDEGTVAYDNSYDAPAPTAPVEPTVTDEGEDEGELVEDGCEAFGLVYDAANNTCVDDELEINIINPPVEEPTEPELIEDGCEAFGMVEENGVCVEPTIPLAGDEDENEYNDIIDPLAFTVTPGKYTLVATWMTNDAVSSVRIERTREGNSYSNDTYPTGNSWTYASFSCSAHSFKLIANMFDGTTIETEATEFLKPANCE